MTLGRRDAIAAMGAGLAVASVPALASAQSARSIDFASAPGRLRAFMLMRGALDDRLVMSWANARYFGVIDDQVTPLFGVVSCVFAQWRPTPDGGYATVTAEFAYYLDLVSGAVIDRFHNPYTDKDCAVPMGGFVPARLLLGPDLSFALARPRPGFVFNHDVHPIMVLADDVWLTEWSSGTSQIPGHDRPFRYAESVIYHASRAAVEAPGALCVPSDVSFTNVKSWNAWLGMDGHPGHLTAIGMGKMGVARDDLPPIWLTTTQARHPELLRDPLAKLAPLWDAR